MRPPDERVSPDSTDGHIVNVRPWVDPLVDRLGHDPRSAYVETYWLGVIGPTATWALRRFATAFEQHPEGFCVDLEALAASLGVSHAKGATSPFGRSLQRLVMFGLAQPLSDGYLVRRHVPTIAQRHLRRLPVDLQRAHADHPVAAAGPLLAAGPIRR